MPAIFHSPVTELHAVWINCLIFTESQAQFLQITVPNSQAQRCLHGVMKQESIIISSNHAKLPRMRLLNHSMVACVMNILTNQYFDLFLRREK